MYLILLIVLCNQLEKDNKKVRSRCNCNYITWLFVILLLDLVMATVLTRPTTKELTDVLSDRVDWYELGVQLNISSGTLNAIKEENSTVKRRLIAMLEKWLSKYPERGWSDVVNALRVMERNDVANELVGKHCTITADSSLGM